MKYTDEQRAIIHRLEEATARFDAAAVAAQRNLIDITTAMIRALNQTGELVTLNRQCGDLFREFLDAL